MVGVIKGKNSIIQIKSDWINKINLEIIGNHIWCGITYYLDLPNIFVFTFKKFILESI